MGLESWLQVSQDDTAFITIWQDSDPFPSGLCGGEIGDGVKWGGVFTPSSHVVAAQCVFACDTSGLRSGPQ